MLTDGGGHLGTAEHNLLHGRLAQVKVPVLQTNGFVVLGAVLNVDGRCLSRV